MDATGAGRRIAHRAKVPNGTSHQVSTEVCRRRAMTGQAAGERVDRVLEA